MDTTLPFTVGTYSSFVNNIDALVGTPGLSPNPATVLTPAAQALATNPDKYQPPAGGTQALQQKSQGQYSNKQFIAPFKYEINVEGTWMTVDCLGKRVITDNTVPYRAIASLSATTVEIKTIDNTFIRTVQQATSETTGNKQSPVGTPIQNSAAQQFNTGAGAVASLLGSRFAQYSSLITGGGAQVLSNLTSGNLFSGATGIINNILPTTQINQTIAKIPGLSVVTTALGNLPGGSNLTSALNNPVGAAESLVGKVASGLNIQLGLPSLKGGSFDLGSIPETFGIGQQLFSTATDIFHNGPPTSLTGLISLEKQVKGLICNFKLPNIQLPSLEQLTTFKFPKPEDIIKQVKKAVEDEVSNIVNIGNIQDQLNGLLAQFDPKKIYEAALKEITTCDSSPTSDQNSKSGKSA